MARRIGRTLATPLWMLMAVPSLLAAEIQSQELRRFNVLVPDLLAQGGADRDFGRDVASELRTLMGTLLTHRAVDLETLDEALDAYDRRMEELECVGARQLASLIGAEVALCASYRETAEGRYDVTAVFWDVQASESFEVPLITGSDRDEAAVARQIFQSFDRYTTHLRAAANCEDFAQSQQWERALANCDEALRLNANATGTRYRRARILYETGSLDEALGELNRVLEASPLHEAALQLAGYVSGMMGRSLDAHDYYSRYLELSPESAAVRMRVAYELARAGDTRGALLLIQEGLDIAPDNVDLWEQAGGYAFSLGETLYQERDMSEGGALPPDAATYFLEAMDAYERVDSIRGAEAPAEVFRRLSIAAFRLKRHGDAAAWADQGLTYYDSDPRLWSARSQALRGMGDLEEALAALERVLALDPEYPGANLRRVSWLLEAERTAEAVSAARVIAESDEDDGNTAARIFLARAHTYGVQRDRFDFAVSLLGPAAALPNLTEATRHELHFWLGYSLLRDAAVDQEPRTVETARATLPRFQRALEILEDVGDYPASVRVDVEEIRSAVRSFIEIQEAIIRRGW